MTAMTTASPDVDDPTAAAVGPVDGVEVVVWNGDGPPPEGEVELWVPHYATRADVIDRGHELRGLRVQLVQNITDVGHLTDDSVQWCADLLADCGVCALFAVAIFSVGLAVGRTRARSSL